MAILCFDIGGTDIKYGVIDNEKILEKGTMPTNPYLGQENVSNRLLEVAKKYQKDMAINWYLMICLSPLKMGKYLV